MKNTINSIYALLLLILCTNAFGHQLSTAYFSATVDQENQLSAELQVKLYDLEQAVGLDMNSNGELTWAETLSQQAAITSWVQDKLTVMSNNSICEPQFGERLQIDSHFNESYLVIPIIYNCKDSGTLNIEYNGLKDLESSHKLLVNISSGDKVSNRIISHENNVIEFDVNKSTASKTFVEYTKQGIIHILIGLDHIVFLLCLIMAVILNHPKINNLNQSKQLFLPLIKVITAFTVAHSITLTASILNWIQFSTQWVEVIIAFTVLLTAINNIFPLFKKIVIVTFIFGLIHGMGFASVLNELGLSGKQQMLSLFSFNLGVELGQLSLLLVTIPLLILFKKVYSHSNFVLKIASGVIALLSIYWILQRLNFIS